MEQIPVWKPGANFNDQIQHFKHHAYRAQYQYFFGIFRTVHRSFFRPAVHLSFNEMFRRMLFSQPLNSSSTTHALGMNIIAGGLTGFAVSIFYVPLDRVRLLMVLDHGFGAERKYNSPIDCIKKTIAEKGWGQNGLYKGFTLSSLSVAIYRSLHFGIYNTFARSPETNLSYKLGIGFAATVIADYISCPIDAMRIAHGGRTVSPQNVFELGREVVASKGWFGLFARHSHTYPVSARIQPMLTLVIFDYLMTSAQGRVAVRS